MLGRVGRRGKPRGRPRVTRTGGTHASAPWGPAMIRFQKPETGFAFPSSRSHVFSATEITRVIFSRPNVSQLFPSVSFPTHGC